MLIREAKEAELFELFRIQLLALGLTDILDSLGPGDTPALYRYGIQHGRTVVAEEHGRPAGFAVGYVRDGTWFLGEFFVHPEAQSAGIGQALLSEIMPSGLPCATMTTADPRAQALYARSGMTPRWPSFNLRAETAAMRLPAPAAGVWEVAGGSRELHAWDTSICGRWRPEDLRFLRDDWNGALLWIGVDGRKVGYAGVARRGAGRVTVGPIGVRDSDDGEAAALAAIGWAAEQPGIDKITLDVAAPHNALRPLLECGFRIMDTNLFCATDPARFGDPARYVPLTPAVY